MGFIPNIVPRVLQLRVRFPALISSPSRQRAPPWEQGDPVPGLPPQLCPPLLGRTNDDPLGVHLIEIKAVGLTFRNAGIDESDGGRTMPTEIIVIAIVISVFCTFAGALYWGDLQTRRPGEEAKRSLRQ